MFLYSEQEKIALDIAQRLNGLPYALAKAILDEAHEKILGALKVSLSEDDLKPSDKSPDTPLQAR